ncbi:TetR/AcrR family transcriptional regulator [Sphaerisporangium fuscum]|uniref:TetR/AcrR family transcriptional regulator n=1 Tax=Sphaerisporangium fuscum TaxID=2835868 RepID=UPI001BDC0EA7|nr:TetR/AcrR family transcriptional regulator [Sphaerisporangium fuscum]
MTKDQLQGPVWTRMPKAGRRQALTVGRIVEVATRMADAGGLEALSMRTLAAELGSGTTSLYRHVSGRDDLIDLMVDAVQGEEPTGPPSGDWRADLAAVTRRLRAVLLRHPWLARVLTARPALGPNALRRMDEALLAARGLTGDITLASAVVGLLTNYVQGAVAAELAEQEAQRRTGMSEEQWRASVGPYIREVVTSGEYPEFGRRVIEARDLGFEEHFEFGLACLLDGVAARSVDRPGGEG